MTEVPKTMRAAVYRGVNDVRVETIPVPEIGSSEVLVRIHTCGICGTDLKKIHTGSHSAPRIFGHEMAGTIVAIGDGVTKYAVGDHVMAYHHIPCGECFYCRKHTFAQCETYKKVGCTAGFEPSGGGFAEYVRVMDWIVRKGLVKIPDGVPFEQASFIEPVNTCYKAVAMLNLQPDETVLVIGQGPIGILLAALAKRTGATVLTSDLYARAARCRRKVRARSPAGCTRRCCDRSEDRNRGPWCRCCACRSGWQCPDHCGDECDPSRRSRDVVCGDAAWRGAVRSCCCVHGREDPNGFLQLVGRDQRRSRAAGSERLQGWI